MGLFHTFFLMMSVSYIKNIQRIYLVYQRYIIIKKGTEQTHFSRLRISKVYVECLHIQGVFYVFTKYIPGILQHQKKAEYLETYNINLFMIY